MNDLTPHYHARELTFLVRPQTTDTNIVREVVEGDNYKIEGILKPKDVVIDVGGHIGTFTVFATTFGANVFTYEPVAENFELLKKNIEYNCHVPNVPNINRLAVMAKEGKREVYIRPINYGGSNMYNKHDFEQWKEMVECTTLEKVFKDNNLDHCDFLKMDCEGAELEILESFHDLSLIKRIALEYTDNERREKLLDIILKTHNMISDQSNERMGTLIFQIK